MLLNILHVLHFHDILSDNCHSLAYTTKVHKHMLLMHMQTDEVCVDILELCIPKVFYRNCGWM